MWKRPRRIQKILKINVIRKRIPKPKISIISTLVIINGKMKDTKIPIEPVAA